MSGELHSQLKNPKDILSLLLLVGGDVVQRAIAQMFGVYVQPFPRGPKIYLTPVAFSFGWVGYAFTSLSAVVGDKQLMPGTPEGTSIVINCDNGYTRTNRSWLLGRIIRDHELTVEERPGLEAAKLRDNSKNRQLAGCPADMPSIIPFLMRIDIFDLQEPLEMPAIDSVWVVGWVTILVQLVISVIPWILSGNWSIFFVTSSGTLFALLTGSLRQWGREKWPGQQSHRLDPGTSPSTIEASVGGIDEERGQISGKRASRPHTAAETDRASKKKVICLARGNGHKYVMILRGSKSAPDLESLATATSDSLPETKWVVTGLALLWIILLIGVSGIQTHTWFLLGIGALGMLQNIYAASVTRNHESMGLKMTPYATRPTIIGAHIDPETKTWDPTTTERADNPALDSMMVNDPLIYDWLEPWETPGVRGALRELEKTVPKAGIALMPEYFPALWKIDSERYRDKEEERFWRWMFKNPMMSDRDIGSG